MANKVPRKLGWLPGSYHATQLDGPSRSGAAARGAFDVAYDNGPQPADVPAPARPVLPRPKVIPPAPQPVPEPTKPKSWKTPPFAPGDVVICGARNGAYSPCDCGHIYFMVGKGHGQIPARLRCQRCGKGNRELRRSHVSEECRP
jgi:hypothetical protein